MMDIGLIGTGRVAPQHTAAMRSAGARVVAVYDTDPVRAGDFAREHNTKVAGSIDDLLADVDAVLVLSPADHHLEHAFAAIAAGRHVLVEKPVSWSAAAIAELDKAARDAGVICVPGHNSIHQFEVRRMRRSLKDGEFGAPVSLEISETYRMPDEIAARYRGPLEEVLIHHVYTAIFLLGRPDTVQASAASPLDGLAVRPQQVAVIAAWESQGVLAQLYQSWAANDHSVSPRTHRLHLIGTSGSATMSRRALVGALEPGGNPTTPLYQELFDEQAAQFLLQIGRGEAPLSSLMDASDAAAVIAAVRDSLATGHAVRPAYAATL